MINFIICDDYKPYREITLKIIKNYLLNNEFEHNILEFDDYDDSFLNLIDEKIKKVYILDIEVPSMSGLDVARRIRKKDSDSPIIFFSSHDLSVASDYLSVPVTFYVNKMENYEDELYECIDVSVNYLKLQD